VQEGAAPFPKVIKARVPSGIIILITLFIYSLHKRHGMMGASEVVCQKEG
jgi:hypothetical protein